MTQDASGGRSDGEGRWSAREHAHDGEVVGVERVATWAEETRRYRRSPGGWWWLALLLVPAILAALGSAIGGESGGAKAAGSTSSVTSAAPTSGTTSSSTSNSPSSTSSDTATSGGSAAGDVSSGVFSISRSGDEVTVAADVPDEAGRTALLEAVKAAVGGAKIVDHVNVVPGATAASTVAVSSALGSLTNAGDFGLAWDLKSLTAVGNVDSEDAKKSIGAALGAAWPDVRVQNDVVVGTDAAAVCSNLGGQITVALASTKITFERGSTDVKSTSTGVIKKVASLLAACKDAKVTVTGYTDSSGSKAENLALSKGRATSVGKILTSNGVSSDRITIKGLADADPVANDNAPGGREANRRVEITVN